MSTVNVSLVPVDEIRNIWEDISEYVGKAAHYTYGRYKEIDILHECLTNKFNLWVAYKEGP